MAGSSSTVTESRNWTSLDPDKIIRVDVAYVADDSDGSIPDAVTDTYGGSVVGVTHAPGGTVATTLFDVVAEDGNTIDVLCGAGANIVTTANMARVPNPDAAAFIAFPVVGKLTVKFTNNSVNSATGVFSIFIAQGTGRI
jgi:hypothetical protein